MQTTSKAVLEGKDSVVHGWFFVKLRNGMYEWERKERCEAYEKDCWLYFNGEGWEIGVLRAQGFYVAEILGKDTSNSTKKPIKKYGYE